MFMILVNQYSISRLCFTELSLCVFPPTLGRNRPLKQAVSEILGHKHSCPLGPLTEWGTVRDCKPEEAEEV